MLETPRLLASSTPRLLAFRGSRVTTLSVRQTVALVALFVVTSLTFIQLDNRRALDPFKD